MKGVDSKSITAQLQERTQGAAWEEVKIDTDGDNAKKTEASAGSVTIVTLTGHKWRFEFQPEWRVEQLKESVAATTKIPINQQRLMIGQKTLMHGKALGFYGIQDGSTITMICGLFANAQGAQKIAFAIDLSGSMRTKTSADGNETRIQVVIKHLHKALDAALSVGCSFGMGTFTSEADLPLGSKLMQCTKENIDAAKKIASGWKSPYGNNGAEGQCLSNLLAMDPDLIFFLGDGGWKKEPLIEAAKEAKQKGIKINSIAFFTTGGGLQEIAEMTGGEHRKVTSPEDYRLD